MKLSIAACVPALTAIAVLGLAAHGDAAVGNAQWPTREFEFARLKYRDRSCPFGQPCYTVDQPEAEQFFHKGVSRLTRVDMAQRGQVLEFDDDALFDYPWLYAVEVGYWLLDDYEAGRLREYLLRGGFLMVDDFHGTDQYRKFEVGMHQVFPDRPILDILDGDEVLHVVYDVDERIQIPGMAALAANRTYEQDGFEPVWKGIYDDKGRLMVAINHNMDLGDSWEEADEPSYPQEMTTLGLRFAVNYVIYAMTH
jgi:hypothetical protein